jgi:mannosyltransferase OCH1-like enzyme
MTHSFPKIIWQTHNHKQEWLPEHLRAVASSWVNLNPEWEYRYVDQVQREETVKKYPKIYETYKYQLPVIQSDVWRFIALYENGGCYADMDSVPLMALDYMIDKIGGDPEIITIPENKGMGNTHNFLVKKHSPILKKVVEGLDQWAETPNENFDKLQPFMLHVNTVYAPEHADRVSKLFEVNHSLDYKKRFVTNRHNINNYGTMMKYEDYVRENNLELVYKFDGRV